MQRKNRILIGLVLLGLAYACNLISVNLWALTVLVVALIAFREFKVLCNNMGIYPLATWISFFIVVFLLLPLSLKGHQAPELVYLILATLIITSYVTIFPRILLKTEYTRFEDLTTSLWAIFQFALLPSFFVWIRMMDKGFYYTLLIIFVIAANDSGSLLLGKLLGKTKLAPQISPGKTIAGSIGGLMFSTLVFVVFAKLWEINLNESFWIKIFSWLKNNFSNFNREIFQICVLALLGLIYGVLAQIGDLLVSALKRAAGVKDSGTLLLSHGGVLDRVDSHFFAVWFAYIIFGYLIK